jgi:CRP-like cAMP-binding protein
MDSNVLADVALFAELTEADRQRISTELRPRQYRKGQTIFVAGDPGSNLCIVSSGLVKLVLASAEGREVALDVLGPGDVFGELALLDGEPRSADAVAVESTQLLLLQRDAFVRVLHERPEAAITLIAVLSRRLRRDAQLLQDAAFLDVPARLARAILRLAKSGVDGAHRTPRMSQSDLAAVVGTTRETLNKWLGFFSDQGWIRLEQGRVTVLDAASLQRRIY